MGKASHAFEFLTRNSSLEVFYVSKNVGGIFFRGIVKKHTADLTLLIKLKKIIGL